MQAAAQRPTLKRGKWAKIFDGKVHKRYYFFNVQTKQSQWTEPPEWASLAPVEIIVGNGKANNNNAKKVVQTVRLNLGSLGATGLAAAKLQKKVEKKLLQQSLSSKKGTSFAQQAKLGKKKKTKTYCAICDVKVNHASLMASHLAGKKHKAALLLFKRTGKLAPGGTKGKGSAASMNSFKIDPAKKAERASRFAAEYVEKVHLGKEDNSHKRIKAWGGDRVEHNADEAIAKLLERKRKAVIADAIEKGLDPDEELRKRKDLVDPKLLKIALTVSSKKSASSTKVSSSEATSGTATSAASSNTMTNNVPKRKIAGGPAPKKKKMYGKWTL